MVCVITYSFCIGFGGGRTTHPPPEECGIMSPPSLGIYCPASVDDMDWLLPIMQTDRYVQLLSCEIGGVRF